MTDIMAEITAEREAAPVPVEEVKAQEAPAPVEPATPATEAPAPEATTEAPKAEDPAPAPEEVPLWKQNLQVDPMEEMRRQVAQLQALQQAQQALPQAQPQQAPQAFDAQIAELDKALDEGRITGAQYLNARDQIKEAQILERVTGTIAQREQTQRIQAEEAQFAGRVLESAQKDADLAGAVRFLSTPNHGFGGNAPIDALHPQVQAVLRTSDNPGPLVKAIGSDGNLFRDAINNPAMALYRLGQVASANVNQAKPAIIAKPSAPPANAQKPIEEAGGGGKMDRSIDDMSLSELAKKYRL
jgi:hypothetical protein